MHLVGGDFETAVNEGVRRGYINGYLRKSSLDPVKRENYGDNTPAIIHIEIVPGDKLKISVATKGFGAENMSEVVLFPPATGIDGIKRFVVEKVAKAGANACPPVIVGIGLGGNLEKAALIAKKSLLRPLGVRHPDPEIAQIEEDILTEINRLGIGPQGLGGSVTALDVHIETYPTHIGSLPVAVNLAVPLSPPQGAVHYKLSTRMKYMQTICLSTPISDEAVRTLKAGDKVLISGTIYTARDAAHKRLVDLLQRGDALPMELQGQIIYYSGPTPPKPGMAIGSAGPTTSYRMDPYTPKLLENGLKGMIGKGPRGDEVISAIKKYKAAYFAATGGVAALLSKTVKTCQVVAYEDLGTEAIHKLQVEDFPVIVINDTEGNDLYREGKEKYQDR